MIEIISCDADYGLPKDYAEFDGKFKPCREEKNNSGNLPIAKELSHKTQNKRFSWESL